MSFRTRFQKFDKKKTPVDEVSRTLQSFKDESNINNIVRRYHKTGQLPDLIKQNPVYGDFSDMPSYHESMNIVAKANEQFAALSSEVRRRFDNDPSRFLEFASDASNAEEMVRLGLAIKRPVEGQGEVKNGQNISHDEDSGAANGQKTRRTGNQPSKSAPSGEEK